MAHSRRHDARIAVGAALLGSLALAPVSSGGSQEPIRQLRDISTAALTVRDSVVSIARAQVGRKYLFGGSTPSRGFDCSGLVQYVLETLRIDVPRTSREQSRIGLQVQHDTSVLLPGDLLMFGKAKDGVSHVGIYVGHGRYVHASSVAGRVIESPLDRPPSQLIKVLKDARRVLAFADEPVAWVRAPASVRATPAVTTATVVAFASQRGRE